MCSDSQRNCYETKQNLHVITFWVAVFPVCILIWKFNKEILKRIFISKQPWNVFHNDSITLMIQKGEFRQLSTKILSVVASLIGTR